MSRIVLGYSSIAIDHHHPLLAFVVVLQHFIMSSRYFYDIV